MIFECQRNENSPSVTLLKLYLRYQVEDRPDEADFQPSLSAERAVRGCQHLGSIRSLARPVSVGAAADVGGYARTPGIAATCPTTPRRFSSFTQMAAPSTSIRICFSDRRIQDRDLLAFLKLAVAVLRCPTNSRHRTATLGTAAESLLS